MGFDTLIGYFDLQSAFRKSQPQLQGRTTDGVSEHLTVFPQYAALVLGILTQPALEAFRTSSEWHVDWNKAIGWAVFALIAGLIIFPSVYRKTFDPQQPKFVQFCVIFVAGIGWKTLFATAAVISSS